MLHTKLQGHWPSSSGEDNFYVYKAQKTSLLIDHNIKIIDLMVRE